MRRVSVSLSSIILQGSYIRRHTPQREREKKRGANDREWQECLTRRANDLTILVFRLTLLFISCQIEREKKRARQRKLLVASQDFVGRTDEKDGENGTLLPNNTTMSIIPVNTDSLA